jgi:hypothetical protein
MGVNRSWGPPALEDIWLGSIVHRLYCSASANGARHPSAGSGAPLRLIHLSSAHTFNGGWHTGRGHEFNTSWLYHNKHELPLIEEHVRQTHVQGQPLLQCDDDGGGPLRRRDRGGGKRRRQRPHRLGAQRSDEPAGSSEGAIPYASALERAHGRYMREAGCTVPRTWCTLVEPRYLSKDRRYYEPAARINRAARQLTREEAARIESYHTQVRAARKAFQEQLQAEKITGGDVRRGHDYEHI